MQYNYHTHTYMCGHASGTPEEYIERAIKCGIKHMGFSDHSPFIFPDGYESPHRVPCAGAREYVSMLCDLREKYKEYIDINIGFEMEYYPLYFESMFDFVKELECEYLILGQHYSSDEHPDRGHVINEHYKEEDLKQYVDYVISAMKTGKFTYVAHPDMFHFRGDLVKYKKEMRKICIASKEYNVPLEVNFLGIRENRIYPNLLFWEIAGEEAAPVTFGFDTHDTINAFDGESLVKAKKIVEKYHLNYIGKPDNVFI